VSKIYLISPSKINKNDFLPRLSRVLRTSLVPIFQLRIKEYPYSEIKIIAKEVKKICDDNNCVFIVNDYYDIARDVGANGVHIGLEDNSLQNIAKYFDKNFIVGVSCYDSKQLALQAQENNASYVSFGAFYETKTKKSKGKPSIDLIRWAKENLNIPNVAIGGINNINCENLVKAKADYIAVISYVWNAIDNEENAIKSLNKACVFNGTATN
jgi:thiamine-phosphate pyrophosphorylase